MKALIYCIPRSVSVEYYRFRSEVAQSASGINMRVDAVTVWEVVKKPSVWVGFEVPIRDFKTYSYGSAADTDRAFERTHVTSRACWSKAVTPDHINNVSVGIAGKIVSRHWLHRPDEEGQASLASGARRRHQNLHRSSQADSGYVVRDDSSALRSHFVSVRCCIRVLHE